MKDIRKKGQVQYFMENAFRIGFLIVALVVFFMLINFFILNKIDTKEIQAEIVVSRILYSDAIMYEDENTLRVYSGIVDMKKFNDETINAKINYPIKRHATASIELIDNVEGKIVETIYLNKAQYDNLNILASGDLEGKGGATKYPKTYPVTYYDKGNYKYGTLKIIVIVPNS
ncbi:MAG TPA: hypothetical protein VEC16_01895 [Alphaproteobacteria bacterium]|nr:hypothetical protein [Alphaproteobacteria bacterium]